MEFQDRLQKAVRRGQQRSERRDREAAEKALNEEELKGLHTQYRLDLSEHIEKCVRQLPNHFPGFKLETIFGESGWGAAVSRDDVDMKQGRQRENLFSRLEMTIRPFSSVHVLDLAAKGTIRNKEVYNRSHFEKLNEVDTDNYVELIDLWVLEYAELYSARS